MVPLLICHLMFSRLSCSGLGVLSLLHEVKQGLLTFIAPKEGDVSMGHNEMKVPQGQGLSD